MLEWIRTTISMWMALPHNYVANWSFNIKQLVGHRKTLTLKRFCDCSLLEFSLDTVIRCPLRDRRGPLWWLRPLHLLLKPSVPPWISSQLIRKSHLISSEASIDKSNNTESTMRPLVVLGGGASGESSPPPLPFLPPPTPPHPSHPPPQILCFSVPYNR